MKIRMLTLMAGPDGVVRAGEIVDRVDGKDLIKAGYAVAVDGAAKPEEPKPEEAVPEEVKPEEPKSSKK